jgi:CheY-like chemotaxis protein
MAPTPNILSSAVLVVEDDDLVRAMAVDSLDDAAYSVLAAASADEAWEILESRRDIGVLFTDIEMPGPVDGVELASCIAIVGRIRLVLTSGPRRLASRDVPDDGSFIPKPYEPDHVLAAFGKLARANHVLAGKHGVPGSYLELSWCYGHCVSDALDEKARPETPAEGS